MTATVNQAGDVRRTLERTWNRLAKPGGEDPLPERWLDELAHAVEAQMPNGGQADDTAALRADVEQLRGALASAMAERNQFRIDCSQLADQLEAKQREVERLGRVHDELLGKIRDLEARQEELGRQNADALADREDLQELFDLQHRRMGAATELWRAEEPDERALVSPDLGALLEWLMERTAPATEPQHGHEHRHAWELDPESGLFVDCSCELPYPRDLVDVEDDELSPVAEPLDEFMLQLRQELEQVGFPSRLDAEPATELLVTDQHGAVYITPPPDEQTEPPVEREAKRSTRKVAECGTASGYARHRRDDEDACDACKAATARAKRERVAQRKAAAAGEECFADEPCAPTYMEFDPDCYPPSCPWCALNAEIEAHSGCEHKRHGPWRRWKIVHKIEGWAYVLGIVSGARFSWGGGCSGCMTIYFKGRRPYILGWERWKWSCLFRGRHWPGEYVGLDACGKCLPCPECGSTTAGHKADCPTGWGDAA